MKKLLVIYAAVKGFCDRMPLEISLILFPLIIVLGLTFFSGMPLCHCLIFGCLITLDLMYLLIVFLPLLGSSVAGFFGRFLGSEGTAKMTTTCVSLISIFSICIYLYIGLSLIFLLYEIGLFLLRVRNYQRTRKEKMALVFQYVSIRFFFIILKPWKRLLVYFFYSILVRLFSGVWELDLSYFHICEFDLTKKMVNSSDKAVILYKAPSPGGAVEIFEVSTTSSDLSGGTPVNEGASNRNPNFEKGGPSAASSSPNGGEVTSGNRQIQSNHSEAVGPHIPINRYINLEQSLHSRIRTLYKNDSAFLFDKTATQYWDDIQERIKKAETQKYYSSLLDFESRDLQLRELKHRIAHGINEVLSNMGLQAYTLDKEEILIYFDEMETEKKELFTQDTRAIEHLEQEAKALEQLGRFSPIFHDFQTKHDSIPFPP